MAARQPRYHTKQQDAVYEFVTATPGVYLTVDQIADGLRDAGKQVGRTTVYRALERFASDGALSAIPSNGSDPIRYGYVELDGAKLVCTQCHRVTFVDCDDLHGFIDHIEKHHQFHLHPHSTVLYGLCCDCAHGPGEDHAS